ncbi:MAG TPA: hypothetical protein VEA80_07160 [Vitreimonas sp.]|uniref:hypothetical protein n=1 Tax=Vitreimonas sp. TaxID=3069702 RepID=UPI002D50979B|nr:hypothetical protein [Vitreimonas sp.]HYD87235.1 hypothetical protein [Vitreimonas sp.]
MRTALMALAMIAFSATGVAAQDDEPPPQCRYNAAGQIDYQACLDAARDGSPWQMLSLINLGTQAYNNADFPRAAAYYDRAQPRDGGMMYSDPLYHANYAATLYQVGRSADALVQARMALAVLHNAPEVPEAVRNSVGAHPVDRDLVYAGILPVLHAGNDPQAETAMAEYLALPAQDWVSWANRAAVMLEIGDYPAALRANERALQMEAAHPAVQNNQCYILVKLERAGDALAYCERARAGAPDVAAVRHSVASAYAALGRCADAEREMSEARRLDAVSPEYREAMACTPA